MIKDQEVSEDEILPASLREAWKWLRNALQSSPMGITPTESKGGETSRLKDRPLQSRSEKAGFTQKQLLHQQAYFILNKRCGLGMIWRLHYKQVKR